VTSLLSPETQFLKSEVMIGHMAGALFLDHCTKCQENGGCTARGSKRTHSFPQHALTLPGFGWRYSVAFERISATALLVTSIFFKQENTQRCQ
jgi:hypothetical protein